MRFTLPRFVAKELKSELANSKNVTLSDLKAKLINLTNEANPSPTAQEIQNSLKTKKSSRNFFASNTSDAHTQKNKYHSSFQTSQKDQNTHKAFTYRSRGNNKDAESKNKKLQDIHSRIVWTGGFSSSEDHVSKAKTSYQAKSEFDAMIKDWISTNWLNADKLSIQKKPCHFLIHDKLAFNGLSVFNAVLAGFRKQFPDIKFPAKTLRQRWNDEFCTMSVSDGGDNPEFIRKKLRELVKTVFIPSFKLCDKNPDVLDLYIAKPDFERSIDTTLHKSIRLNERMISYLKNFENLNPKNSFTYIKDRELSLLPALDYTSLIYKSKGTKRVFKKFSVLQYDYVFGNKVNDFKNLEKVRDIMDSIPTKINPYFIIMTGDKQTSLEYYRLLKLMKQMKGDAHLTDKKGCVVYLNEKLGPETGSFFPPDTKNHADYGSQLYNIIDHFGEIYDVLEAL